VIPEVDHTRVGGLDVEFECLSPGRIVVPVHLSSLDLVSSDVLVLIYHPNVRMRIACPIVMDGNELLGFHYTYGQFHGFS